MSPRERKGASRQQDTIAIYKRLLAEEEAKPGTGAKGRQKEPRRRTFERMVEVCGFSHWTSAQTAVRRWEPSQRPLEFETFGMELSDEFAAMIRTKQDKAKRIIAAQIELKAAEAEVNGEVEIPTHLCPFCKACFSGCEYCEGDGWYEGFPMIPGGFSSKLLDEDDIHVEYKGKVIPIEDLP